MTTRLVLVGGGLAHLHVLREWRRRTPPSGVELLIVSPALTTVYSGMVPAFLRGAHGEEAMRVDIATLARCAGARFVEGTATRVRMSDGMVETTAGELGLELCSLDVGSGVPGDDVPGVREHAVPLRPMTRAAELRHRVDGLVASGRPFDVVVVGAGLGGVEVALALHARIAAASALGTVRLVDRAATLLAGEGASMRNLVAGVLGDRGVGLVLGSEIVSVGASAVTLASGASLPAHVVAWVPGTAPPRVLASSDLPLDAAGYLQVDRTLRAVDGARAWGAGDCASVAGSVVPRSGAYAVRQGPVLLDNLRAALSEGRMRTWRPRRRSLAIIDTADGRAVARWGSHERRGRWAWWLKRRIDERFVNRFRVECDEIAVPAS